MQKIGLVRPTSWPAGMWLQKAGEIAGKPVAGDTGSTGLGCAVVIPPRSGARVAYNTLPTARAR